MIDDRIKKNMNDKLELLGFLRCPVCFQRCLIYKISIIAKK